MAKHPDSIGRGMPRAAKPPAMKPRAKRSAKARQVLAKPPEIQGWQTSDRDELALRQWRGRTDIVSVTPLDAPSDLFGRYRAVSATGGSYEVEIRDLDERINGCGCIDLRVNGLGTCKHIEGVLAALAHGKARTFKAAGKTGSPYVEIFLDRREGARPVLKQPGSETAQSNVALAWLHEQFGGPDLPVEPQGIRELIDAFALAPAPVRQGLRLSAGFAAWLEREARLARRVAQRRAFEEDLAAGKANFDVVKAKLLPYQEIGAMHLAFGERALLADDMGLGKTIQAIAAVEIAASQRPIERVLIVCPASLKGEWEEQIARFSGRSTRLVFGPRAQRLEAYGDPSFFTVVNYEQVIPDVEDINTRLKPDIVILDEAQRIKNWQTKTARQVKALRSPYAFVLTGTPIENRIDELYSILQFLDPEILGPLFRFNRNFYELDERGRPIGFRNLSKLNQIVAPVMLRRRKAEVEKELPGRTIRTFLVPMAEEQLLRYEDYAAPARQLIARSQRRPLTKQEFDRLQQLLACMRMICDTPAILDPTCRISPKLEELEPILEELLADPTRKVIIFSEWERMLSLVRELAGEMRVEAAWHTGSLPQQQRRAEIVRFKQDPACRLFLSTDSGSTGLNLQMASAVINLDLPWNPAKLEQRIARAWRKNQMRSVDVINLVAENTIEHNIQHLLSAKQALADGVLDRMGDLDTLKLPSGRAAMIARLEGLMAEPPKPAALLLPPEQQFVADLAGRHGDRLVRVDERRDGDGRIRLLVVLDGDAATIAREATRLEAELPFTADFIDTATDAAMRRLAAAGVVQFGVEAKVLHAQKRETEPPRSPRRDGQRIETLMAQARRANRMANLLIAGGFAEEAPIGLGKAITRAGAALALVQDRAAEAESLSGQDVPAQGPALDWLRGEEVAAGLVDLWDGVTSVEEASAAASRSLAAAVGAFLDRIDRLARGLARAA